MVTHRLTALEKFNLLCIIDSSHLVEQGHYHQLIQQEKGFLNNLLNEFKSKKYVQITPHF